MPLDLPRRSGEDPIQHGSRTLLGLRWRDHHRASGRGGQRFRADDGNCADCASGTPDPAGSRGTGDIAYSARFLGAAGRGAAATVAGRARAFGAARRSASAAASSATSRRRRIGTRTAYEYTDIHDILLAGALVAVAWLVATA